MRKLGSEVRRTRQAAPASVWVCPECFDVYDARTVSGDCPNEGHASVRLIEAPVRSLARPDTGPVSIAA